MKKCPKCGCERFAVSAHVVQDWTVDANGDFVKVNDDCIDVTHFPSDDDIWDCVNCGYSAAGAEFNVVDESVSGIQTTIDAFVFVVVKEHDWTMPSYTRESYKNYEDYTLRCLSVGTNYLDDVCQIVKERLMNAGKFAEADDAYKDLVHKSAWNSIKDAIIHNMTPNPQIK